mmetsp:Transcript_21933/g.70662  ORF Transcript_21933/g.70662 Transcript_21933/m.70662 type:complete len:317 (-) Transcript_21933:107-1057(-)
MVQAGEAGNGEGVVEPGVDELLRRGLKKLGELTAAAVEVVLVRHDDLQPVLARLLDLLGQPLVADEAVLVEVEQHVGRVVSSLGGGDGEAGKGGDELLGQLPRAGVGRRGPDLCERGEAECPDPQLARHCERKGGASQKVGRTKEQRLGGDLERDKLKLPDRERPVLVKDVGLQVLGALVAQRLQRPAALVRVRFLDEDERLVLLERRADLSEAVLGAEVALREEEEDGLRALDVLLQRPDILEIIYVEKDFDVRQQLLELTLDDLDGVLTGRPDVAVEEVPREAHPDAQLGGLLGRDETDCGDLGDATGGDDGTD